MRHIVIPSGRSCINQHARFQQLEKVVSGDMELRSTELQMQEEDKCLTMGKCHSAGLSPWCTNKRRWLTILHRSSDWASLMSGKAGFQNKCAEAARSFFPVCL